MSRLSLAMLGFGLPLHTADAACVTSGNVAALQCGPWDAQMIGNTGSSSLSISDLALVSVAVLSNPSASGPFSQSLTVTGATTLNRSDYPALYMYSSQSGWNADLLIGASVNITSAGPFGAVWLRSESNDTSTQNTITVDSAATVSAYGTNADGITATSNNGPVSITNRGAVTAASGRGLYADGGSASLTPVAVTVTNLGSVYGYLAGIRAIVYNGDAVVTNEGSIRSTTRQGIIGWSANGGARIDNSGTVVADHYDAVVAAGTGGNVAVTNSGSITANRNLNLAQVSPDFHAISAYSSGIGAVSVTNLLNGRLVANWDAGMAGASDTGALSMTNEGEITALTGILAESNAGTVSLDNTGTISAATGIQVNAAAQASIANSGTIAGRLTAFRVSDGVDASIVNRRQGRAIGGVELGTLADLSNDGLMVLKQGATLAAYATTGTATASSIGGDFVQSGSGRLQLAVDTSSSYSTLAVGGTANLGGSLVLDVADAYDGGTLADVILANGGVFDNGLSLTDNSLRYRFEALYQANSLSLVARDTGITSIRAAAVQHLPGATGAAAVWDRLRLDGTATGELQTMLQGILAAEDEYAVVAALEQSLPLVSGDMSLASFGTLGRVNAALRARLSSFAGPADPGISNIVTGSIAPARGLAAAPVLAEDELVLEHHAWITGFAGRDRFASADGRTGFETERFGSVAGVDGDLTEQTRLGLAFAYSHTDLTTDATGPRQGAEANTYQLALYGRHALSPESGLFFQLDAGRSFVEGYRRIDAIGATAMSDYGSTVAHAGLGLDRSFHLSGDTVLTPSLSLDYSWMKDEAYRETGAGAANLLVEENTRDSLVLGAAGELTHALTDRLSAAVRVGASYDLVADAGRVEAAYAGASGSAFETRGGKRAPFQVEAALALSYTGPTGLGVTGRYDVWHAREATGHAAGLELFLRF